MGVLRNEREKTKEREDEKGCRENTIQFHPHIENERIKNPAVPQCCKLLTHVYLALGSPSPVCS
jgi:hypothetical protein